MNPTLMVENAVPVMLTKTLFDPIRSELDQVEQVLASTLSPYRRRISDLMNHLKHFKGKRLRPVLVILAAKACGRVVSSHFTLAAVIEMIHTATLVHDDVLDEASIRRHVDTVNARWGNKTSILLGDLLFTHAFHLSATSGDARICERIGEATNRVCAGELFQLTEHGNLHLTEDAYFEMIDGKTAALTEVACRIGAMLAGANDHVCESLAIFGQKLGLAFQVADDLLDLMGDETKTGKTLGTDLEQQKMTLPLIHLLEVVDGAEADSLRDAMRHPTEANIQRILTALRVHGSLEYAQRRADELIAEGRAALQCLPSSTAKTMLEQLGTWAVRRQS
ncbi:polyprenyl synthetase family protein [Tuwongella immobilis]|uniref:Uncharacterized protein n=1 Tax=Tuwongella immobilis TaxID=692036 RepID=A0A6C2YNR8_9BACT|nr:polyprenyl synthetase family protein [Tuwongella immobilis]VIP03268.1 polyprenyl synthetase : Trans-hexaprenyltranstransferase OS=Planctomyces limnophilus (strain ATCC 43296 / DSM 3776 / IFAM 1008 / 290) GN=Plim_0149 PE=3 SV=1: polyprenyl_synt [Tuwongella immobilis]VTS03892.1 polyprenyl synthetase : Trans-hexaprenyltranstransferase OS=Planctomyces limnophilus (strain ATCC 43296 / DSM 3776 / IFAM 1008 / 290) GN=Plim_0149 PE=3 SV=1: polyprenyl_synt [Tuwongella immobilis]